MDVVASFVAHTQAAKLMKPGERAFDDPTMQAQAATVGRSPPWDDGLDTTVLKLSAVRVRVVRPVGIDAVRSLSRSAGFAGDGTDVVHERDQLCDIVAICPGERGRERDAIGIRDQVVFRAEFASIRWT